MKLTNKRVFCLVTGASRGFGRALAASFTNACVEQGATSVDLLLHARPASHQRLQDVADDLRAACSVPEKLPLSVRTVVCDFGSSPTAVDAVVGSLPAVAPDVAVLFNSAGVCVPGAPDDSEVLTSLLVNAIAPAQLATRFAVSFPSPGSQVYIALVSSKGALAPIPNMGPYCASKAAAEMLHRSVALQHPDARIVLYAPGRMNTDMAGDSNVKAAFGTPTEMILPDPAVSADTLIQLLEEDRFKNGGHLDIADFRVEPRGNVRVARPG